MDLLDIAAELAEMNDEMEESFRGHKGRPGKRGGSSPRSGGGALPPGTTGQFPLGPQLRAMRIGMGARAFAQFMRPYYGYGAVLRAFRGGARGGGIRRRRKR